jgi:succinate-semialdehyde dehydrogenase/glutarate-semialdehyde dehydrogenase
VHASVHDEFCERLVSAIRETIVVGDGLDEATTMGPLISSQAVDKVNARVQEAIKEGATCLLGGHALSDIGPYFYAPTVLTNVSPESDIFKEETFGPVIPIVKFETDEEALRLANDSSVGLAGYFCTENLSRAFSFAKALECGLVGVNEGIISTALAPFGGVKESGMGREGSPMGIAEYLETKYIFMNA